MATSQKSKGKRYSLSHNQARRLAGSNWQLLGTKCQFVAMDPEDKGSPPWFRGVEGYAYPIIDARGTTTFYAKFFKVNMLSRKRVDRTKWLIDQRIDLRAAELRGAPRLWSDTEVHGRPDGLDFDFCCSVCDSVPGKTWEALKGDIATGRLRLNDELRLRCCHSLIRALAVLERFKLVHGDLSHGNVMIDVNAKGHDPALHIIDFDGFYSKKAGRLAGLSFGEGGTYGTPGYCPPELERRAEVDQDKTVPFSDRHARDMLLLEFLSFGKGCDSENAISLWDESKVRSLIQKNYLIHHIPYLASPNLMSFNEASRPSSLVLNGPVSSTTVAMGNSLPSAPDKSGPSRAIFLVLWALAMAMWAWKCFSVVDSLMPNVEGGSQVLLTISKGLVSFGGLVTGLWILSSLSSSSPHGMTFHWHFGDVSLPHVRWPGCRKRHWLVRAGLLLVMIAGLMVWT